MPKPSVTRSSGCRARYVVLKFATTFLSNEYYVRLRAWFSERAWEKWDEEIERDGVAGKLDFLVEEAVAEKSQGHLEKL